MVVGDYSYSLELQFSANATVRLFATAHRSQLIIYAQADSLRSSLGELEGLLTKYSPLMNKSTEKVVDMVLKHGATLAKVSSPICKLARR